MSQLPELNREFAGISNSAAMHAEIDTLRGQLDESTAQLALERSLAMDIHRARSVAIGNSPALKLVFGVGDDADTPKDRIDIPIDAILSAAFMRNISSTALPEGFATTTAKNLRTLHHPDIGGDTQVAQDIDHGLAKLDKDPGFSIAAALLAAPKQAESDVRSLRLERYRLHLALTGSKPVFDDADQANQSAETEIKGAEWRVRTQAVFKSFELIIGSNEAWNHFLQQIVDTQHMHLIGMVNRIQPIMLGLQERLAKGDPTTLDSSAIETIDSVFERLWSAIGNKKDSVIPYSPPYQNWLEVLLPAMKLLDPGQKPGEEYTSFEPPIRVVSAPKQYNDYDGYERKMRNWTLGQNLINYQEKY